MKQARKEAQVDIEKIENARQKDRTHFEMDRQKFQQQLDAMSRKLEKKTGEQLGDEGELDLLVELRKAFQKDRIERIGRGKKGADIVQEVTEDSKVVGRIIYESKNVSTWSNKFIEQAKKYQSQYDTPNVIVVSQAFPSKKKGLCILKGIPVVDLRQTVSLATIMREGILTVASLRLSGQARDEKAQELFDYIISDKFVTRFREVGEHVTTLRDRQLKEREWHEIAWEQQKRIYDQLDSRRREIDSHIKAITISSFEKKPLRMAARA